MRLDTYYQRFTDAILQQDVAASAYWRQFAGQRFFYIASPLPATQLACQLLATGERITADTKLKLECVYVRSDSSQHVFRVRFLVPQEKQFCCGNLCEDCFLLRQPRS
ncbi:MULTISPECIES: hypothetical protein [Bacillales]|jgi:hypothetical protein|uniref:Nicotinate phosphoribosyltransferase n=1 Tax=Brevibacillus aydinogluensis TaxID=927786 RepID=A0AA48RHR2_9BACL|nr:MULTISPECIES: hypothetical protein [Bacillales]REK62398.1 MAG: hypothetical protein DF221_13980 [Brevibacillus sp.]MBR8659162.1 hypothetical protein [Brevibacillus sp. NL20B1]MDT3415192.1 hypothetical protein [Brevibacillus aydinogluensis]NNV02794.1 hypothetical protein [Brevibacillus sp. MCWH]UFJ60296.1 hypothetical protein IRT44_13485 [Anoxybacillus sediminis]